MDVHKIQRTITKHTYIGTKAILLHARIYAPELQGVEFYSEYPAESCLGEYVIK